jgi:outer membrane usher protein
MPPDQSTTPPEKYRTTNGKGIVLYDNLTPFRENALMLDVSDSHSTIRHIQHQRVFTERREVVIEHNPFPVSGAIFLPIHPKLHAGQRESLRWRGALVRGHQSGESIIRYLRDFAASSISAFSRNGVRLS